MTKFRVAGAILVVMSMLMGCGPSRKESTEALELARLLRGIMPEAGQLRDNETQYAAQLKITLEEAGSENLSEFRFRFDALVANLSVIRDRRQELLMKVRQGWWITPLVHVVQASAITAIQDELSRTEGWIMLAQNVRFRAEMGRQKDFPEVDILKKQLEYFVGESQAPPLTKQLMALLEEYKFVEADISP